MRRLFTRGSSLQMSNKSNSRASSPANSIRDKCGRGNLLKKGLSIEMHETMLTTQSVIGLKTDKTTP